MSNTNIWLGVTAVTDDPTDEHVGMVVLFGLGGINVIEESTTGGSVLTMMDGTTQERMAIEVMESPQTLLRKLQNAAAEVE